MEHQIFFDPLIVDGKRLGLCLSRLVLSGFGGSGLSRATSPQGGGPPGSGLCLTALALSDIDLVVATFLLLAHLDGTGLVLTARSTGESGSGALGLSRSPGFPGFGLFGRSLGCRICTDAADNGRTVLGPLVFMEVLGYTLDLLAVSAPFVVGIDVTGGRADKGGRVGFRCGTVGRPVEHRCVQAQVDAGLFVSLYPLVLVNPFLG